VSGESGVCEHLVQIYDDDAMLMETHSHYVMVGLLAGEAAIIIATKAHLAKLEEQLIADEVDIEAVREKDRYIPLVADETLALFMKDGMPDDELFASAMLPVLARAQKNGRKVRRSRLARWLSVCTHWRNCPHTDRRCWWQCVRGTSVRLFPAAAATAGWCCGINWYVWRSRVSKASRADASA
jgi:hypothetical protein